MPFAIILLNLLESSLETLTSPTTAPALTLCQVLNSSNRSLSIPAFSFLDFYYYLIKFSSSFYFSSICQLLGLKPFLCRVKTVQWSRQVKWLCLFKTYKETGKFNLSFSVLENFQAFTNLKVIIMKTIIALKISYYWLINGEFGLGSTKYTSFYTTFLSIN